MIEKLKTVDRILNQARAQALGLHWKEATALTAKAAQTFFSINASASLTGSSNCKNEIVIWDLLATEQSKLTRTVELAAGIQMEASADLSDVAVGNESINRRGRDKVQEGQQRVPDQADTVKQTMSDDPQADTSTGRPQNPAWGHPHDARRNQKRPRRTICRPPGRPARAGFLTARGSTVRDYRT